jgi:hypothetical protein
MPNLKSVAGLVFSLLSAVVATAAVDDYSPFSANEHPASANVVTWTALTHNEVLGKSLHFEFAESPTAYPQVTVDWDNDPDVCQVQLRLKDGTVIFTTKVDSSMGGTEVYSADLNGDKVPDYIIATDTGTNGLGPNSCITFLLSTPKGYIVQSLIGNSTDPATDFFDFKKDGHPTLLYTVLVEGEKGKDGKVHNYWVHNLIGFDGGNLISANVQDKRFPCWILYTFKPNHQPESQLTPEQRTRLWAAGDGDPSAYKEIYPHLSFSNKLAALEKEQAK